MFRRLFIISLTVLSLTSSIFAIKPGNGVVIELKYFGQTFSVIVDEAEWNNSTLEQREALKQRYQLELALLEKTGTQPLMQNEKIDFRSSKINPEQKALRWLISGNEINDIKDISSIFPKDKAFVQFSECLKKKHKRIMKTIKNFYKESPEISEKIEANIIKIEESCRDGIIKPLYEEPLKHDINTPDVSRPVTENSSSIFLLHNGLTDKELNIHQLLLEQDSHYRALISDMEKGLSPEDITRTLGEHFRYYGNNGLNSKDVYKYKITKNFNAKKGGSNPRVYFFYDQVTGKWVLLHSHYKHYVGPEKPKEVQKLNKTLDSRVVKYQDGEASPELKEEPSKIAAPDEVSNREQTWNENFDLVSKYIEENGSTPDQKVVFEGKNIGRWLATQRVTYNKGKLSSERIAKLEGLTNWSWKDQRGKKSTEKEPVELKTKKETDLSWEQKLDQDWNNNFNALHDHLEKGFPLPTTKDVIKDSEGNKINIGPWINVQRGNYKKKKLSPKRIIMLESLSGWTWKGKIGFPYGKPDKTLEILGNDNTSSDDFLNTAPEIIEQLIKDPEGTELSEEKIDIIYSHIFEYRDDVDLKELHGLYMSLPLGLQQELLDRALLDLGENSSFDLNTDMLAYIDQKTRIRREFTDYFDNPEDLEKFTTDYMGSYKIGLENDYWGPNFYADRSLSKKDAGTFITSKINEYLPADKFRIDVRDAIETFIKYIISNNITLGDKEATLIFGTDNSKGIYEFLSSPLRSLLGYLSIADGLTINNNRAETAVKNDLSKYDYYSPLSLIEGFNDDLRIRFHEEMLEKLVTIDSNPEAQRLLGIEQEKPKDDKKSTKKSDSEKAPELNTNVEVPQDKIEKKTKKETKPDLSTSTDQKTPGKEISADVKNKQLTEFMDLAKELDIPTSDRVIEKMSNLENVTPEIWKQLYDIMMNEYLNNEYCALCGSIIPLMYSETEIPKEIWEMTISILDTPEIDNDVKELLIKSIFSEGNKVIPSELINSANKVMDSNELISNWEGSLRKLEKLPTINELLNITKNVANDNIKKWDVELADVLAKWNSGGSKNLSKVREVSLNRVKGLAERGLISTELMEFLISTKQQNGNGEHPLMTWLAIVLSKLSKDEAKQIEFINILEEKLKTNSEDIKTILKDATAVMHRPQNPKERKTNSLAFDALDPKEIETLFKISNFRITVKERINDYRQNIVQKPSSETLLTKMQKEMKSSSTDLMDLINEYALHIAVEKGLKLEIEDLNIIYGHEGCEFLPIHDYLLENSSPEDMDANAILMYFGILAEQSPSMKRDVSIKINKVFSERFGLLNGGKVDPNSKEALKIRSVADKIEIKFLMPKNYVEQRMIKL